MTPTTSTRAQLLASGMKLFAERGFDGTSVGDIESSVGLQPRRGALYKHFPSKQALLEAGVRAHLSDARVFARQVGSLDLTSVARVDASLLRPMIEVLGRWFLMQMDQLEGLTRMCEHDAARLAPMLDELREQMVDLSYATAARLISAARPDTPDVEALSVVILSPLVALRRTAWTFGKPPLGVDDERFLDVWARHTETALDR